MPQMIVSDHHKASLCQIFRCIFITLDKLHHSVKNLQHAADFSLLRSPLHRMNLCPSIAGIKCKLPFYRHSCSSFLFCSFTLFHYIMSFKNTEGGSLRTSPSYVFYVTALCQLSRFQPSIL